ncbi:hypothetical protein Tsubulata_034702 [Turnera subulata]|uniref:NUC153 domain-containing protein n=1 Tax=Turnera subulata TaxID=218843 RepID=A0A9Q0JDS6_9ROSI|nr:hypothetical protein Tsubulata_034702 [Turnera subulata]
MGTKNGEGKKEKKNKNKSGKAKRSKGSAGDEGRSNVIEDPRFAGIHTDPRFQKVPERKLKVSIDSRFSRMLTDKNFATSSAPLDKRGRPKKQRPMDLLGRYYQIDEEEEEGKKRKKKKEVTESSSESESEEEELRRPKKKSEETESSSSESESEEEEELESAKKKNEDTESSSESEPEGSDVESSTDEDDDEEMDFDDGPDDVETENVALTEEATRRLAIVNMDWRHVRAVDLYVVLSSFLPRGGEILSVTVYPSEFGLERMKEEEVRGPVGLFDDDEEEEDDSEDDDSNDDEIEYEKLLAYEKSRLRYYFAVVEFDSVATADHVYKTCDGVEFERSSNVLDLRFIPDSMEFKHPPRDVATEAPSNYEHLDFLTKPLQHTNPGISWDEDEPQRVKSLKRKFNAEQLGDLELNEFLASDESESDIDENDKATEDKADKKQTKRDKYRALLQSGDGSDGDGEEEGQDMEVTFNTGLEDLSKRLLEKKDKKSESVWEAYLRKRREKKKASKNKSNYSSDEESDDSDEEQPEEPDDFFIEEPLADKGNNMNAQGKGRRKEKELQDTDEEAEASRAELELLLADDKGTSNGLKGYNLKPKKSKGKPGKEVLEEEKIPAAMYDDPRFSALFTSPLFALDPTDPQFKRSAAYARQLALKKQKFDGQELMQGEHGKESKQTELSSDDPEKDTDGGMVSEILPAKKEKLELSSLVRSIKTKAIEGQLPSEGKTSKKVKLQKGDKEVMKNPDLSTLVQSVKKKAKLLKK